MTREISISKRLEAVRFYFEGLSYDEIARRTGISKGSITTIVEDLRDGVIPDLEHISDMANDMRELAVQLRKATVTPAEASVFFVLLKRFVALGVEVAHLNSWVTMCQSIPSEEFTKSDVIRAATKLVELERQGVTYEAAIEKLSRAATEINDIKTDIEALKLERQELEGKKNSLQTACSNLEREQNRLEETVGNLDQQTANLSANYQQLEGEIKERQVILHELQEKLPKLESEALALEQAVEEKTEALQALAKTGFSTEDLGKLQTVLAEIAARHGMAWHGMAKQICLIDSSRSWTLTTRC